MPLAAPAVPETRVTAAAIVRWKLAIHRASSQQVVPSRQAVSRYLVAQLGQPAVAISELRLLMASWQWRTVSWAYAQPGMPVGLH